MPQVVRSLSSCQGALLLVDATQGVQAQTLTTFRAAQEAGIKVLPVVTKIDLPNAQVEDTIFSMAATFDLDPEHVLATSAKTGQGIDAVLETIVKHVPPPPSEWDAAAPLRARVLDSWYDPLRGVVCLVQCVDGVLAEGDRISTCHLMSGAAAAGAGQGGGDTTFSVQEVGLLTPAPVRTRSLWSGQVGYMIGGIKSVRQVLLGDTVIRAGTRKGASDEAPPPPLPLFAPCRPNLFASCFPLDGDDFATLLTAVERLALNDASLQVHRENSTMLGHGLRVGFLGLLHMEVFKQRLDDEFNMAVLVTAPNVPYIFRDRDTGAEVEIENLADWPEEKRRGVTQVLEPMVEATVITPEDCLGSMLTLLQDKRGTELDTKFIDGERVLLVYKLPWQEVVTDLHDKAKSISSGYASLTYRPIDPEPADLVLCEMAINTEVVGALSFVSHRSSVMRLGRDLAARLKKVIPRQQFEVVIQARLGAKPFARERIPPYRKDVLIKSGKTVGGGDPSRKRKLLDKQKEGKRRAKTVGKVQLPQSAFWALLSKDDAG
ncbi:GTP-binding protein lepa C-terminus-domain-containing protein [Tribonema minus]|uniref:Translation factor GUF1 homolog, mitochondrial n=1 Tax=Tribonema minus TaxID=303371 RepID=A0A836CD47_9STRA|nr:GTP-binding protein lepa C-terminus-domain-containing protein [Tribonema minus]